jgi:lipopolysaccharide/colanic/teichoic acid biosynthesis glycosyltransferase
MTPKTTIRPKILAELTINNALSSSAGYPEAKRALDIIGGSVGLILFAILYPVIGTFIKFGSKGPVLVSLERVSQGKIIRLYKFRSMVLDAGAQKSLLAPFNERADGPFFKMRHDPRITTVGKVIRRFRLDEVPQFINVLKGELSLVGPRPHEPLEISQYPDDYKFLAKCKGGITGLSQVNGASSLSFVKELELDSYYAKNVSLSLDLKIIGKTIAILLFDPTAV